MSEFFKALEQAERDRQLAETGKETPAPAAEVQNPEVAQIPEAGRGPAEDLPDSRRAAATSAVPDSPGPPSVPLPTRLGEGRRPAVFARPTPPPERTASRRPVPAAPDGGGRPANEGPAALAINPAPKFVPTPDRQIEPDPPPIQGAGRSETFRSSKGPVLIANLDPRSVAAEAYRTLRANLEFIPSEQSCRTIAITSPSMGEGKSTTAANLAVVAAQAGSRVCLVDADMRRPVMHELFGLRNKGGFTRALSQAMPLSSVALETGVPGLSVVVAGSADGLGPAQLLNAPRVDKVLHDPGTPFDLVILDTPPVISVADTMNLVAHCDGVLLVVRSGALPPSVLRQAVRQITHVKGRILGVLLNQVDLRRGEAEFYRYYRAYYSTPRKD